MLMVGVSFSFFFLAFNSNNNKVSSVPCLTPNLQKTYDTKLSPKKKAMTKMEKKKKKKKGLLDSAQPT
jgi:hypothetical protein